MNGEKKMKQVYIVNKYFYDSNSIDLMVFDSIDKAKNYQNYLKELYSYGKIKTWIDLKEVM